MGIPRLCCNTAHAHNDAASPLHHTAASSVLLALTDLARPIEMLCLCGNSRHQLRRLERFCAGAGAAAEVAAACSTSAASMPLIRQRKKWCISSTFFRSENWSVLNWSTCRLVLGQGWGASEGPCGVNSTNCISLEAHHG